MCRSMISSKPQLSVVINNYNYRRFLPQAIASVLRQREFFAKIIIVDDGSTDDSRNIIEEYRSAVDVLYLENGGQLRACFLAAQLCQTEFIYFLDADDMIAPSFAATIHQHLCDDVSKIQFRLQLIDEYGNLEHSFFPVFPKPYSSSSILNDMIYWGLYTSPPTSGNVFRRSLFNEIDLKACIYETAVDGIILHLSAIRGRIVTLNEPLAWYRVHGLNKHQQHILNSARLEYEINRTRSRIAHFSNYFKYPFDLSKREPGLILERRLMMAASKGEFGSPVLLWRFSVSLLNLKWSVRSRASLFLWAVGVTVFPVWLRRELSKWRLSSKNRPMLVNKIISRTLG